MIEIGISEDIRHYTPKLVGPFTLRQGFCVLFGGIAMYSIWGMEKKAGIDPMSLPIFLLPAVIAGLIGWMKMYGMPFEKFILRYILDNFINPKERVYAIDNFYNHLTDEIPAKDKSNKTLDKKKAADKKKKSEIPIRSLPPELRPFKERYPARHKTVKIV